MPKCETDIIQYTCNVTACNMKKRSEEMQTLRTGCSKAEPKIFTPLQTPFPGTTKI